MKKYTMLALLVGAAFCAVWLLRRSQDDVADDGLPAGSTAAKSRDLTESNGSGKSVSNPGPAGPQPKAGSNPGKEPGRSGAAAAPKSVSETGAVEGGISKQGVAQKGGEPSRDSVSSAATSQTSARGEGAQAAGSNMDLRTRLQAVLDQQLDEKYSRYFETMPVPLSADEMKRFKAILSAEAARKNEINTGMQNSGLSQEARRALMQQATQDTEAQLQALLPPENWTALAQYRPSTMQRGLANDIASQAANNGSSIAPETVDQLTEVLRKRNVFFDSTPREVTQAEYNALTRHDTRTIADAAAILTPEQLEILKQRLSSRFTIRQ